MTDWHPLSGRLGGSRGQMYHVQAKHTTASRMSSSRSTLAEGGGYRISIRDQGPPLENWVLAKVFESRITRRNIGPSEPKWSEKGIRDPMYSGLVARLLLETFVLSSPIQMLNIRNIQASPKKSKMKTRVVWRFLVQTQPTIIVRSGLLNNKSRIKWDQCQGHHRDEWSRWQWSEGGERLRERVLRLSC